MSATRRSRHSASSVATYPLIPDWMAAAYGAVAVATVGTCASAGFEILQLALRLAEGIARFEGSQIDVEACVLGAELVGRGGQEVAGQAQAERVKSARQGRRAAPMHAEHEYDSAA